MNSLKRRRAGQFALLALVFASWAMAQDEPPAPPQSMATVEEIVVEGDRPGPGIWQVSKGDHNLWILPALDPLPRKMTWHSQQVDQRIAQSQVVLGVPQFQAKVGFFRSLTLVPSLLKAEKSPDGQKLEQTIPHDVYIRWLALRVKYLGSSDDEKKRPMLAAFDLYRHAIDQVGLTSDSIVWDAVEKSAKKNHVPIQPVVYMVPIEDPKASIRELANIPRESEIECFTKTIDHLEKDLQPMIKRANYWALGDIEGLKNLATTDNSESCTNAFLMAPRIKALFDNAASEIEKLWFTTAEHALETNANSFAVVPLDDLLVKEGNPLDKFRAKGYTVTEP
jgi:uncharacterized protein YbaP (TraB family)